MYDEPYRWIEAVGNRRQYLDEQFTQGSPVVALSYADGVLLLSVSKGTPKLYEIYDRIGLGGMGHPADLEKLRFAVLEMAHLEGFNRSPSDVTGARLMKYGLAPAIKQAFEEIYKAPYIVKIVLAELGTTAAKDAFLTINYDATFEEQRGMAVVAATPAATQAMRASLQSSGVDGTATLERALQAAVEAWAIGSLAQRRVERTDGRADHEAAPPDAGVPDRAAIVSHIRETLADRRFECAVLERQAATSSTYRALDVAELTSLLPADLKP